MLIKSSEKFVLITGASGGVGSSISKRLIIDGWNVGVCTRNSASDAIKELEALDSSKTKVFEFDLTDYSSVDNTVLQIKEWCNGKLNGLINNAGKAHGGLIQTTHIRDIKEIFECNVFSLVYFTQKVYRYLRRANGASIINISSIASVSPGRGQVGYGVSKAALNALTTVMASEFRDDNILVNAILPAVLNAGMADQMTDEAIARQLQHMVHGAVVDVADVTELVSVLLERRISSQTGQLIKLDNGMLL